MQALIDWLQFTYKPIDSNGDSEPINESDVVSEILGLDFGQFKPRKGLYFYKDGIENENVSVFFNGINEDMGYHVQMSGKGCRYMETKVNFNWGIFLTSLLAKGCKFSRIDVAIDDKEYLDMNVVKTHLAENAVSTLFKGYKFIQEYHFGDNKMKSETIYFGERTSDVFIRMYRKDLQSDGKIDAIRLETVMKRDRAQNFVLAYCNPESWYDLKGLISQVLGKYIRFLSEKKSEKGNVTRISTAKWWDEFLDSVEKLSLCNGKEDITMEKVCHWYERQVAAGLRLLCETKGELYVERVWLTAKLSARHKRLKVRYLAEKRGEQSA